MTPHRIAAPCAMALIDHTLHSHSLNILLKKPTVALRLTECEDFEMWGERVALLVTVKCMRGGLHACGGYMDGCEDREELGYVKGGDYGR